MAVPTSATADLRPSVLDQDDVAMVTKALTENFLTDVISTNEGRGSVTAAAIRLLQYACHFLRWNGGILRTPEEIGKLVSPGSFVEDIKAAQPDDIPEQIFRLFRYSISVTRANSRVMVFGVALALDAIYYAMKEKAVDSMLLLLNWTIIDTTTNTVSLNIGPLKAFGDQSPLLDGLMVAKVLYPNIHYTAALDDVPLIPKHDSDTQITNEDYGHYGGQHRILVPGGGFTNHYVSSITRNNRREGSVNVTLPLQQGYMYFEHPEFLQGLLTLAGTVGVQQPWIALEVQTGETWGPATIQ